MGLAILISKIVKLFKLKIYETIDGYASIFIFP